MNAPEVISGIAGCCERYDLFLVDLWGVVHDGRQAHAEAIDCMRRIRDTGATLILISNAPRPSASVAEQMHGLGLPDDTYDGLITSGDVTVRALTRREDAAIKAMPPAYFHVGPAERSAPLLAAVPDQEVALEDAGYLLVSGVVDDLTESAEDYREFLVNAAARDLPMICVNPDRYVMRGSDVHPCAGALADIYEEIGGKVHWHGKPGGLVFDMALEAANTLRTGDPLPEPPHSRMVMVGDGLKTDILGANQYGFASILVADGLLALENPLLKAGQIDLQVLAQLCRNERAYPEMTMVRFGW